MNKPQDVPAHLHRVAAFAALVEEHWNVVDLAAALAAHAHAGQVDKQGRDYVDAHLRPIAESLTVYGDHAVAAGWLHDLLEDTDWTIEDLIVLGLPDEVLVAVVTVTRATGPSGRKEPYAGLIYRCTRHSTGNRVKVADNAWNLANNDLLARTDPDAARAMREQRYEPARETLLGAGFVASDDYARILEVQRTHLARLGAAPAASA